MSPTQKIRRAWSLFWLVLVGADAFAQFPPGGFGGRDAETGGSLVRTEGGVIVDEDTVRTAREIASHSTGTPEWTNRPGFEADTFTFARIVFKSADTSGRRGRYEWGRGPKLGWWVDFPDADLNLSYRLQQLTTLRASPEGRVLKLTDPTLANYPFIYVTHPGYMKLSDGEVAALAGYLRNGGVLLVNDFWGTHDWDSFAEQMRRVLPGRQWTELGMEHPLFNCVYKIPGPMQALQVPTLQFWNRDFDPRDPESKLQRVYRGEGAETMHVRALYDDHQRMMILAIHNSDIPDGWERESESEDYFKAFSEKIAYPLGVNIVFYLMTH